MASLLARRRAIRAPDGVDWIFTRHGNCQDKALITTRTNYTARDLRGYSALSPGGALLQGLPFVDGKDPAENRPEMEIHLE
jgi:hypothetical protein